MGRRRCGALALVGDAVKRRALGSLAALALLGVLACEPPPPCPDCPRTPSAGPRDAGPLDVGHSSPPVPRDGGHDWPDVGLECSEEDLEAWAAFFRRVDFVDVLTRCSADPNCGGEPCAPSQCVRVVARSGCSSAIERSFDCLATHCAEWCFSDAAASACRWCACVSDCAAEAGRIDPCRSCDESSRTCAPHRLEAAVLLSILP